MSLIWQTKYSTEFRRIFCRIPLNIRPNSAEYSIWQMSVRPCNFPIIAWMLQKNKLTHSNYSIEDEQNSQFCLHSWRWIFHDFLLQLRWNHIFLVAASIEGNFRSLKISFSFSTPLRCVEYLNGILMKFHGWIIEILIMYFFFQDWLIRWA